MKLNLEEILQSATVILRKKKAEKGFPKEWIENLEIVSDQVKALAEALVNAINASQNSSV